MTALTHQIAPRDAALRSGAPVKVLYIIGWGRSGSTIMDNLLGAMDGFFSTGELTYIWERGLLEGRRCGCGRSLATCEVWSAVLARGFDGSAGRSVDPAKVVAWQREVVRVRHTWSLLRRARARRDAPPVLQALAEVTGRLLEAVAEVTGARVIVDSSKRPSDAALLRLVPGVAPYFVHLVRDPRAVAYSWQRRKAQPDRDRPADMVPHGPIDSTLSWLGWNLAAEALRFGNHRSVLVRYEDFVTRPEDALARIARMVGEPNARLPLEEGRARLAPNHTVSGNPSRFTTGTVELREDREWITRQGRRDRLAVTALALPLMHRYGYPLDPAHTPEER